MLLRPSGPARICFNPRPPRGEGATHQDPAGLAVACGFQSSPSPGGGRYPVPRGGTRGDPGFNPRPPRGEGATRGRDAWKARPRRFNPRPPRGEGATPLVCPLPPGLIVSILALPGGRALPPARTRTLGSGKFQSSPSPGGGRYAALATGGLSALYGAVCANRRCGRQNAPVHRAHGFHVSK